VCDASLSVHDGMIGDRLDGAARACTIAQTHFPIFVMSDSQQDRAGFNWQQLAWGPMLGYTVSPLLARFGHLIEACHYGKANATARPGACHACIPHTHLVLHRSSCRTAGVLHDLERALSSFMVWLFLTFISFLHTTRCPEFMAMPERMRLQCMVETPGILLHVHR
jgi:hypothetical protein